MTNIDINTLLPERDIFYFARQKKKRFDSTKKSSETDIIKMLYIWWTFFQQTVGIPMDTNCVPVLAD